MDEIMRVAIEEMAAAQPVLGMRQMVLESMLPHSTIGTLHILNDKLEPRTSMEFWDVCALYGEAAGKLLRKTRGDWYPNNPDRPYEALEELVEGKPEALDLLDQYERAELVGLVELVGGMLCAVKGASITFTGPLRVLCAEAVATKSAALVCAGRMIVDKHPEDSAAAVDEAARLGGEIGEMVLGRGKDWTEANALEAPRMLLACHGSRGDYEELLSKKLPKEWISPICSGWLDG